MKRRGGKKTLAVVLFCSVVVATFIACFMTVAMKFVATFSQLGETIHSRLLEKHGVVFCADFDNPLPEDSVSGKSIDCHNAPRVPTDSGHGRRILPGRKKSFVMAASIPQRIQDEATFVMSLAPDGLEDRQEIINAASLSSGLVVWIQDGLVVASLRSGTNKTEIAAVWPSSSRERVCLAISVSKESAAIFFNGSEAARADLPSPVPLLSRRWTLPVNIRYRFSGIVDSVAIWNKPLSLVEIKDAARRGFDPVASSEPLLSAVIAVGQHAIAFASSAIRVFDRLVPMRGRPAVLRDDCPILVLHTTSSDERHFLRAHEKSLSNGYRTEKAADLRTIHAVFGGRRAALRSCLDDIYGREPICRRAAFILQGDFPELLGDGGTARLYPPEAHSIIHIGARDVLPLSGRFVRLYEGNSFKGIYAIEPFDAQGAAWIARGDIRRALYYNDRPKPSDEPPQGLSVDEARRRIAALTLSDNLFPWSAAELRLRRRHHEKTRLRMGLKDYSSPIASTAVILAKNRAPMFITDNLDLAAAGDGISWESSEPETISDTGLVNRPEGSIHRIVTLSATKRETGERQDYRLRVMGRDRTLPSLFLNIGTLPSKGRRIDFTATLVRCGDEATIPLNGLVGAGGGLRHRGNTAYAKGVKRPMALKFDAPVDWPDPGHPATRILLCSGRADATRLKNKIAFDAFGAAFAAGGFPSPRFAHCELFINGEWMGVWEACGSVRDLLPEKSLIYKVRGTNTYLWRVRDTSILDCVTHPEELSADPYSPIDGLFGFTSSAPDSQFAADVGSRFFIENLIGYFLVVNFTDNADGIFMNQYFARRPGEDRFLIIPWDCDETFLQGGRILSNRLFSRLFTQCPGMAETMHGKWRELRSGLLSDEALFGRINEDAAALAPYMDEEWRLLKPEGFDGDFADALSNLIEAVHRQLAFLDSVWLKEEAE